MENQTLWICGLYTGDGKDSGKWDLIGVFDSKKKAVECAMIDNQCFVGPVELNKNLGLEPTKWDGLFYPWINSIPV